MGFDMSKILNYVFIGVGLILAVIISPLVSNAGESMYSSIRDHCNLNGNRFVDVLNIPGSGSNPTIRVALKGGSPSGGSTPCATADSTPALYNTGDDSTTSDPNGGTATAPNSGKTPYAHLRSPQSDTNDITIQASATNWQGLDLNPKGVWHPRPVIGRSLEGAHNIVVAILTPAVAISIIGGMGVSVWMNMSGMSSQSMMSRFGQQLSAVIGVVIVGVISPLIINFAGDWAVSVQQLTSAQLLAPVYGILFDLIPLMLAFVMVALAALPAWGGIAGRGARMLQERYAM